MLWETIWLDLSDVSALRLSSKCAFPESSAAPLALSCDHRSGSHGLSHPALIPFDQRAPWRRKPKLGIRVAPSPLPKSLGRGSRPAQDPPAAIGLRLEPLAGDSQPIFSQWSWPAPLCIRRPVTRPPSDPPPRCYRPSDHRAGPRHNSAKGCRRPPLRFVIQDRDSIFSRPESRGSVSVDFTHSPRKLRAVGAPPAMCARDAPDPAAAPHSIWD